MPHEITGMILAGGTSRRMGTDKSFLDLVGEPVISHVIRAVAAAFPRVLLITNDPDKYARFGIPMTPDIIPGVGTLGGIHAGLSSITSGAAFITASDMPFIRREVMDYLVGAFNDTDAVVPYLRGEYEPLLAVYSRRCLPEIEATIASRRRRAVDFLSRVRLRTVLDDEFRSVDPALVSIFNINTPEDYARANLIAQELDW